MKLSVVGLNHETADEAVRAKAGFIKREVLETDLNLKPYFDEVVTLSTCNRSEIYVFGDGDVGKVVDVFTGRGIGEEYLYTYTEDKALEHLFEVSAGLNSIVTFEDQILGQLKQALALAAKAGSSGKFLNKYFREAVHFGKYVRENYRVSQVPTSMSATCVKYLKRIFKDYAHKKILVIGSGTMGRLALRHLKDEGFKDITVTNRTYHPGDSELEIFRDVKRIDYASRYEVLPEMDAVICATSSAHTILRDDAMPPVGELYMFDLAMPIDIERKIARRDGVHLFNVDDFKEITKQVQDFHDRMKTPVYDDLKAVTLSLKDWKAHTYFDSYLAQINERRDAVFNKFETFLESREDFSREQKKKLKKVFLSGLNDLVMPVILKLKNAGQNEEIKRGIDLLKEIPYERNV